jgi:predicted amidohydrolase YtcJ
MSASHDILDVVMHSGVFTTLDRSKPTANAVAIKGGVFAAVGRREDIVPLADPSTRIIDLKGRRVLPGPIDNHIHYIRGGLTSNAELRWDGVPTLAAAQGMKIMAKNLARALGAGFETSKGPNWRRE